MKKMYLFGMMLLGVMVVAGCTTTTSPTPEDETNTTQESFQSTMQEVFKQGKTVTCEFSMDMEGTPASGIFYVEGKNMRYSTTATAEGVEMNVDVIVKDGYSYSRSNMEPNQGYKMKEVDDGDEYEDVGAEERDLPVNFMCKKGVPSDIFDLPANITFQEFNYDNSDI